jgi:hypothetical protein
VHVNVDLLYGNFNEKETPPDKHHAEERSGTFEQPAGDRLVPDNISDSRRNTGKSRRRPPLTRCRNKTRVLATYSRAPTTGKEALQQICTKQLKASFAELLCRRHAKYLAAIVRQFETDLRMRKGVMLNDVGKVIILRGLGPHEFAASRRVKKEVADRYSRSSISLPNL